MKKRRRRTRKREDVHVQPSILTYTRPTRVWEARREKERATLREQACVARRQGEFHAPRSGRLYPRDYLQLIRPCCLLSRSSVGSSYRSSVYRLSLASH